MALHKITIALIAFLAAIGIVIIVGLLSFSPTQPWVLVALLELSPMLALGLSV